MQSYGIRLAGAAVLLGAAGCVAHFQGADLDALLQEPSGRLEQPGAGVRFEDGVLEEGTVVAEERGSAPREARDGRPTEAAAELDADAPIPAEPARTAATGEASTDAARVAATGGSDPAAPPGPPVVDGEPAAAPGAAEPAAAERADPAPETSTEPAAPRETGARESDATETDATETDVSGEVADAAAEAGAGPDADAVSTPAPALVRLERASLGAGGAVADLLVDPRSGAIVAAVLPPVDGAGLELAFGPLAWSAAADGLVRPRVADAGARARGAARERTSVFDGRELARLRGVVTAIDAVPGAPAEALLKVRDEGNLLHRVLLEGAPLVRWGLPALDVESAVEVEGAWTRDAGGKLLVARRLTRTADGEELVLRDTDGRMRWPELSAGLLSLRALLDAGVETPDGVVHGVRSVCVRPAERRVPSLVLGAAAGERAVEPSALEAGADGGWRLTAALDELPAEAPADLE